LYLGAVPTFLDSERVSWNVDPNLVEEALRVRARHGKLPRALVLVHLYGQSADLDAVLDLCERYEVDVIEDAAESLGASHSSGTPGTLGRVGIFSFNTNKIVTATGGGMLVTSDAKLAGHARKLAAQARDDAPHYQHSEVGYNYRLSNVLAAIGRVQLPRLPTCVALRRTVFERYRTLLAGVPGIEFAPEASWGLHSRWLTCLTLTAEAATTPEQLREALEAHDVEARPLWKPMHLQPAYDGYEYIGGTVAEDLFVRGPCLPSGSGLSERQQQRVVRVIRDQVGFA
jgi:pyridoxal phosphate-dependent aminotransferase EpsN